MPAPARGRARGHGVLGCRHGERTPDATTTPDDIVGAVWELATIELGAVVVSVPEMARPPSLVFSRTGDVDAYDACNWGGGTCRIEGGRMLIEAGGGWTLAGCMFPDDIEQIAELFQRALSRAREVARQVLDTILALLDGD